MLELQGILFWIKEDLCIGKIGLACLVRVLGIDRLLKERQ